VIGGNENHAQRDAGLRNESQTTPPPVQDRGTGQKPTEPSAKHPRNSPQADIDDADPLDDVEAVQLQRRAMNGHSMCSIS
jgi:hypothetical protein